MRQPGYPHALCSDFLDASESGPIIEATPTTEAATSGRGLTKSTPAPAKTREVSMATPKRRSNYEHPESALRLPAGNWVTKPGGVKVFVPAPKPRELKPCGTLAAYRRHLKNREVPCEPCSEASRQYTRDRRGITGPKPLLPHGTHAAYMRHYLAKTKPCELCVIGERRYQRIAKKAARARKRAQKEAA